MNGYQEYAIEHPEADYSGLQESFQEYLKTESAQMIIRTTFLRIIQQNGGVSVTSGQIGELTASLKAGFVDYVNAAGEPEGGWTPETFYDALEAYLQTDGAIGTINTWMNGIFTDKVQSMKIGDEYITGLAAALAAGYQQYAQAGGGPDPSQMGQHFIEYLQTESARNILSDGLASAVDTDAIESQLTQSVESYMRNAMSSYGSAIGQALESQISSAMQQMMSQLATGMSQAMGQAMAQVGSSLENAMNIDGEAFADAFQMNMTGDELAELMMSMSSGQSASYESNLTSLGYVDFDVPSGIDIYPKDFESKEKVVGILDDYNSRMEAEGKDEQVITYTDMVGTLMSSVTEIIDIISYVLIAFVAISLIVSSIMIGVITYISVLERKKEIGILRAIGASKGNISQVFNAETFIIGFCAGALGIIISLLLLIPGNALIHYLAGTNSVNAVLPAVPAVILILLSIVLTLIGGLIPSKKAAKSDPVTALRTE